MKISVALVYHDGGVYIEEQIQSILSQLAGTDELILSVDRAFDGSMDLLQTWEKRDPRVFVTLAVSKGLIQNYAHAISMCSGDLIFLSSQDDPWLPGKVARVKQAFHDKKVMAVVHNGWVMAEGEAGQCETLFQKDPPVKGYGRNLWKISYRGCSMAFRKELIPAILPIPESVLSYEYWIGAMAEVMGEIVFLEEPLFLYRGNQKIWEQETRRLPVKKRLGMFVALLKRKRELENEEK